MAQHVGCPSVTESSSIDDLVEGDDIFFAATGITDGELLRGVRYNRAGATTESLVMRCKSGTVRRISANHNYEKLATISGESYSSRGSN